MEIIFNKIKEQINRRKTVQPGIDGNDETWYVFSASDLYGVMLLVSHQTKATCVNHARQYFDDNVTDIIKEVPLPDLTEILRDEGLRI